MTAASESVGPRSSRTSRPWRPAALPLSRAWPARPALAPRA